MVFWLVPYIRGGGILTNLTVFIVFLLFLLLMMFLISRADYRGLCVVLVALCTVTVGEALNLFVFRMAVYTGVVGIPEYIILAGAMTSWGIYELVEAVSWNRGIYSIPGKLKVVFIISLFLPALEVFGLEAGLWHWTRPMPIVSLNWYLGVWRFYVPVLLTPVVLGILFDFSAERSKFRI